MFHVFEYFCYVSAYLTEIHFLHPFLIITIILIVIIIIIFTPSGKLTEYVEEPVIAGFLNAFGLFLLKSQVSYHNIFSPHFNRCISVLTSIFDFRCFFDVLIFNPNLISVFVLGSVFDLIITFINLSLPLSI